LINNPQYAAQFGGGLTFAATGLPGVTAATATSGLASLLLDDVGYGDPVGNYASDAGGVLSGLVVAQTTSTQNPNGVSMYHLGTVREFGTPSNQAALTQIDQVGVAGLNEITSGTAQNNSAMVEEGSALVFTAETLTISAILNQHLLTLRQRRLP
jgi:hypothetical protein